MKSTKKVKTMTLKTAKFFQKLTGHYNLFFLWCTRHSPSKNSPAAPTTSRAVGAGPTCSGREWELDPCPAHRHVYITTPPDMDGYSPSRKSEPTGSVNPSVGDWVNKESAPSPPLLRALSRKRRSAGEPSQEVKLVARRDRERYRHQALPCSVPLALFLSPVSGLVSSTSFASVWIFW